MAGLVLLPQPATVSPPLLHAIISKWGGLEQEISLQIHEYTLD